LDEDDDMIRLRHAPQQTIERPLKTLLEGGGLGGCRGVGKLPLAHRVLTIGYIGAGEHATYTGSMLRFFFQKLAYRVDISGV
jgi:hypothetical protein